MSWDDLVTVLMEVEQCVNNRPLTYVTSELPNMVALTPNHLLKGEVSQLMPPVSTMDHLDPLYFDHDFLNQQYSRLSEVVKKFVQVWSKDYLTALKEKHFGNVNQCPYKKEILFLCQMTTQGTDGPWDVLPGSFQTLIK